MIAPILGVDVITGEENPGEFERLFIQESDVGFVLTTFSGFKEPNALLATNIYAVEIVDILHLFFAMAGLRFSEHEYTVLPEEREIALIKWPSCILENSLLG